MTCDHRVLDGRSRGSRSLRSPSKHEPGDHEVALCMSNSDLQHKIWKILQIYSLPLTEFLQSHCPNPTMSAISGPSRLAATVADESEELAAEAGLAQTSVSDPNTVTHTNGTEEATKVEPEPEKPAVVEKPEVPCETLYLQNLNEKVQIPSEHHPSHAGG